VVAWSVDFEGVSIGIFVKNAELVIMASLAQKANGSDEGIGMSEEETKRRRT